MLCEKELCTGCAACAAVCPVNAIEMKRDCEGFYHPVVLQNCINCGKCTRTCPIITEKERPDRIFPKAYVMKHKDVHVLEKSASGGMFTTVAQWAFDRGGCIFGAQWDHDFHVKICKAENMDEIIPMRGSKYVYSHAQNAYREAKSELLNGRTVVFTGLPCQISGLYGYLGREFENLYTVEIPCHGAGSELVFDRYREHIEEVAGKRLVDLNHSSKKRPWTKLIRRCVEYSWSDGSKTNKDYLDDSYLSLYMRNVCMNTACFECKGANICRVADMTMGDLMGYGVMEKHSVPERNGVSAVWCNTRKGINIITQLQLENVAMWEKASLEECMTFNCTLWKPTPYPQGRDQFFKEIQTVDFGELEKRYFKDNLVYRTTKVCKKMILRLLGAHFIAYGMYLSKRRNGLLDKVSEQISTFRENMKVD